VRWHLYIMKKELLQEMINEKLVSVQKHPETDLFIYNYSPKVQYEKLWNEVTLKTRGLILDAQMNFVARPFGKFFNLEEHQPNEIPQLPFDVYEKMDGSLGILYWLNDKPFIATRGSFTSDQSQHATEILYNRYQHTFDKLDKKATYLFEIIYPQNRIVVDYGAMDDLVLLTVIDNETGDERIEDIGFPIVKKFDGINDLLELKALEENNKEGFVIRFKNGFRVKMKFAEYVRLHRIITGVSNVVIWEYLAEGKSFEELLEKVPDEFYNWVKKTQSELITQFDKILAESKAVFKELETRKETALYFQAQKHPSILFSMLDKKTPDKIIWKMIRPKYSKPFKTDEV
jgi:RNA ligase